MKFQLIKLVFLLLLLNNLNAQSSFSYKRQLSYKQCQNCDCKKSRSYKIISNNLTSVQMTCAQDDINSTLMMKEMFQNGTSGGLFGGFNPRQEGCGTDCYHEFENVTDNVETVQIRDCLSESEKQKINEKKQKELNDQKLKEEQERLKRQKLLELAQSKDANIQELIKQANAYGDKNDFQNCLTLYEKICAQAKELNGFCKENRFSYSGYEDAVNYYGWYLILNKDYEKALEILNTFFNIDFSKSKFEQSDLDKLCVSNVRIPAGNISHILLFLKKNELFWELHKSMANKSWLKDKWINMIFDDYALFKQKGISISKIENIRFVLMCLFDDKQHIYVSKNASESDNIRIENIGKRELKEYFIRNFPDEMDLQKKLDTNLFKCTISSYENFGEYNFKVVNDLYYYFDLKGDIIFTNTCKTKISPKKEAKIINQAKIIRDKDLGIIPK